MGEGRATAVTDGRGRQGPGGKWFMGRSHGEMVGRSHLAPHSHMVFVVVTPTLRLCVSSLTDIT